MSETNQVSSDNKCSDDGLKEEEEDVPADFFDDFSNQDFMAGLDIVDDDEWENENKASIKVEKNKNPEEDADGSCRSPQKCQSPIRPRYSPRKCSPLSPIRHRRSTDDSDIRRDPEKTKRDIQRDKDKCAKNKEKKLISEKLNVVETGLVPPGMEMEVDLDQIKGKQKSTTPSHSSKGRDTKEPLSRASLERRKRHKSHSRSPMRKRMHRPSPRRYSPMRGSPHRSPRRGSPRRSPRRLSSNRRNSPLHHRRVSPKHRERSYSPRRPRRSRSRSRNRSPRHRKPDDNKKSFLQELAEKLNEPSSNRNVPPIPAPMPNYVPFVPRPVPAPVPPPMQCYNPPAPVMRPFDPYDTQFFIGNQPAVPSMVPNFINNPSTQSAGLPSSSSSNILLNSHQPSTTIPQLDTFSISSSSNDSQPTRPTKAKATAQRAKSNLEQIKTQGDLSKLLEEKKISLSDFLSIAAKPEVQSSDPVQLQEKIKVISRCQEALKFLSNEKQFSGRLCVYTERTVPDSVKWSILKPPPELPFTTPAKINNENSFVRILNRLFRFVGLPNRMPLDDDDMDIVNEDEDMELEPPPAPTISPQKQPPPPPQIQPQQQQQQQQQKQQQQKQKPPIKVKQQLIKNTSILGSKFLMKMVQTDPVKCEQCQLRNSKKYETIGIQCGETLQNTVSTQVCEEDIVPKKTQSLAALTPAQLLGISSSESGGGGGGGGRSADTQQRPNKQDKEVAKPKNRNNFERNRFNQYQGPNRAYSPSRHLRFSPPRTQQDLYIQPLFPAQVDFFDRPPREQPPNYRNQPNYPPRYDGCGYRYF